MLAKIPSRRSSKRLPARAKTLAAALFCLALVCGQAGISAATGPGDQTGPEKKLNDAQAQLHSLEQQLVVQQEKFTQLQGQLQALRAEQDQGEKALGDFSDQLQQNKTDIAQAQGRYDDLESQLNDLVKNAYI